MIKPAASPRKASSLGRLLIVLVAILGVLVAYLVPTEDDRKPRPTAAALFPSALQPTSRLGDRLYASERGEYAYGRWKKPIENVKFHVDYEAPWIVKFKSFFQTKYWHYHSIETDKYFIGSAIVKLGYANDAFLYVVDKTSEDLEKYEWTGRQPADVGLSFAPSSIHKTICTSFTSITSSDQVSFCYDHTKQGWKVHANVTTVGTIHGKRKQLVADVFMEQQEALMVLYPNGNDTMRPAFVHKGAGAPAIGTIAFGDDELQLQKNQALAGIDWTRSMTLRCTRWKWASSNFYAMVTKYVDGQTPKTERAAVGINFSKDVYDIDGESQENAIWINGQVHVLRGVTFAIPEKNPLQEQWIVSSMPGLPKQESVQLRFTPKGSREDHTKLLLVESDFIQPYGQFTGKIAFTAADGVRYQVTVDNAFGVVENHFALW